MKPTFFLVNAFLLFTHCQQDAIPAVGKVIINQQFEIGLHESLVLQGAIGPEAEKRLGKIEFRNLDDSRCPANAMCIRQGAAIATFKVTNGPAAAPQTIRLFLGDFMPGDSRKKRHRTADTVVVQLAKQTRYRLILKKVAPYPGTSDDKPRATLLLERQ